MIHGISISALATPQDPWGLSPVSELRDAGYAYMELVLNSFVSMSEEDFEKFARTILAAPLPARTGACLFPGGISLFGDQEPALEWIEKVCTRCNILGIDTIVFGSGGSRRCPEGMTREEAFDQMASLLKKCGPILAEHQIMLVVEPLNRGETDMFNNTATAAQLVRVVNHPNVRLLVDYFHYARENDLLDPLNVPLIRHTHWAEPVDRTCPAEIDEDFRKFLDILQANGYNGRMTFEGGPANLSREQFLENLKAIPTLIK